MDTPEEMPVDEPRLAPTEGSRRGSAVHTLCSTYRLQLTGAFGFERARAIVDYLSDLGVTDVYLSPILRARRGTTHGYDVVDYSALNEELGTDAEFTALSDALRERGMGLLLDWVPNHMGIADERNRWWYDVLENGESSLFADVFDIDWRAPKEGLRGRVLLPILGDAYGDVLERGDLRVVYEEGFCLSYGGRRLPLGPKSLLPILESIAEKCSRSVAASERDELESIVSAHAHLPDRQETGRTDKLHRAREKEVSRRRLESLLDGAPAVRAAMLETLVALNGSPGLTASFDVLDHLLKAQSYRLSSWRVAAEEINYRRFFDVNDLASIRVELPAVYDAVHAFLFRLIDERRVVALRLDHTDGLYDPTEYFVALQRRFTPSPARDEASTPADRTRPLALIVEKILEPGEQLPSDWLVDGTTGYEFATSVGGLWVDASAEGALTSLYRDFTHDTLSFQDHVYASKHYVLSFSLASEVSMLARALEHIAGSRRKWQDFTLGNLTHALTETLASFPVYRTYLRDGEPVSEADAARIHAAVSTARRRSVSVSPAIFALLGDILLMRTEGTAEERRDHVHFALRFQQLTGSVMAKAVEDTAFYRYNRLVVLNEVGGAPEKFGTTAAEFHHTNAARARCHPLSMTTTSTHDTKRGEDTAARMAVISEFPCEWASAVRRWSVLANEGAPMLGGEPVPSPVHEYLFYQALLGVWPFGWDGADGRTELAGRMTSFLVKAAKEAKQRTSWANPNDAYEAALASFVDRVFGHDVLVRDLARFAAQISPYGAANAIGATVLRLCSPGVADTYQGCELWNQSLVDPDNRRPVDFEERRSILRGLRERVVSPALVRELRDNYADGRLKLFVTATLLAARRAHRGLFLRGEYTPLPGDDDRVAFGRSFEGERLLVFVARLPRVHTGGAKPWAIGTVWGAAHQTMPHPGMYRNLLTGDEINLACEAPLRLIFADLPVAVLMFVRAAT